MKNKKEISLDPGQGIPRLALDPFKCLSKEDKNKECNKEEWYVKN